jgi:hypothetical protein
MAKGLARILLTLGSQCEEMKAAALQTRAKSLAQSALGQSATSAGHASMPERSPEADIELELREYRRRTRARGVSKSIFPAME